MEPTAEEEEPRADGGRRISLPGQAVQYGFWGCATDIKHKIHTVWHRHPVSRDILLGIFDMFHGLLCRPKGN